MRLVTLSRGAASSRAATGLGALVARSLVVAACGGSSKNKTTTTKATATQASTPAAGVAASWTEPGANLRNTRDVASSITDPNVSKLGVAWTVPIKAAGQFGGYASTVVVINGVVYSQDLDSNVEAIKLSTGKVLWTHVYNSPNEGRDGVTVANGTVFAATATSAVALQASTGEQLWSRKLIRNDHKGIDMAPGYNNGTVYVSTVPGNTKGLLPGQRRGDAVGAERQDRQAGLEVG